MGDRPRRESELDRLQSVLEARIAELGAAVVAFSGGVDSSLVAALAWRAVGTRAVAVTAVSPALAEGELAGAAHVARSIGIRHQVVTTRELAREGYRRNGRDRCYHCKMELYGVLGSLASTRSGATVLSGANADDLNDWRPGLRAAAEHGVVHPLLEAGVRKAQVRALSRRLALPAAEKPASPCLASRIPYGVPVEPNVLAQVDRAERSVRRLGYRELRVRHLGSVGKLELAASELPRALEADAADEIRTAIRAAGYGEAVIDTAPFRSGALNRDAPRSVSALPD